MPIHCSPVQQEGQRTNTGVILSVPPRRAAMSRLALWSPSSKEILATEASVQLTVAGLFFRELQAARRPFHTRFSLSTTPLLQIEFTGHWITCVRWFGLLSTGAVIKVAVETRRRSVVPRGQYWLAGLFPVYVRPHGSCVGDTDPSGQKYPASHMSHWCELDKPSDLPYLPTGHNLLKPFEHHDPFGHFCCECVARGCSGVRLTV